jgi:hypothetical protein
VLRNTCDVGENMCQRDNFISQKKASSGLKKRRVSTRRRRESHSRVRAQRGEGECERASEDESAQLAFSVTAKMVRERLQRSLNLAGANAPAK